MADVTSRTPSEPPPDRPQFRSATRAAPHIRHPRSPSAGSGRGRGCAGLVPSSSSDTGWQRVLYPTVAEFARRAECCGAGKAAGRAPGVAVTVCLLTRRPLGWNVASASVTSTSWQGAVLALSSASCRTSSKLTRHQLTEGLCRCAERGNLLDLVGPTIGLWTVHEVKAWWLRGGCLVGWRIGGVDG
jgi:hypothetical protein